MNITCAACQARYSIANGLERRRVTIRCKRCSASIVVDGARSFFEAQPRTTDRDESSVLFSLSNLQSLATQPLEPASRAGSEGSGLIDLRALTQTTLASLPPAIDLVLSLGQPSPRIAAPVLAPPASNGGRTAAFSLALLSVLVACALGLLLVSRHDAPRPSPILAEASPALGPANAPSPAVAAPSFEEPVPEVPERVTAVPVADVRRTSERRSRPLPRERSVPASHVGTETSVSGHPISPERTVPTFELLLARAAPEDSGAARSPASSATPLPDSPARDEVRRVMEALTPAIRACATGVHGRALVSVVVSGATGRAQSATVGGDVRGPSASCIERAAQSIELHPFARARFTLSFPYAL